MVTLSDLATDEVLDLVLADQPDVRHSLEEAWSQAQAAVDPVLLELCRLRIATLLGCDAEYAARNPAAVAAGLSDETIAVLAGWPTSDRFGLRERACLGFTEQFVVDVAAMHDAVVEAVREQLGEQGLVDFVSALLVVEQRQRLRLTWERLFGDGS
jgi:alkylhydroperoxidase family enzyme